MTKRLKPALMTLSISLILAAPTLAQAEPQAEGGKGYALDTNVDHLPETPLYIFKKSAEVKGEGQELHSSYEDPKGKLLVSEVVETGAKASVRSYKFSQKQIGAEAEITVKDGLAKFSYTLGGKTKTSEEKVGEDFIIGPTIVSFLQLHWAEISDGKTVKARFAVPDRLESVGFSYFKEKEETILGKKVWVVKMKPSSFVIAAIVDPLRFYMTPDGQHVVIMRGRTQVKKEVDGKFKDLDTLTVY